MLSEVPDTNLIRVYCSESYFSKKQGSLPYDEARLEILSDAVFAHAADTETPQGILGVVAQSHYSVKEIMEEKDPHILVLENLQNPGNLGTILRTAEGAGVTGILLSRDCVDIYNPKVVRGSMGSLLRMPYAYVEDIHEAIAELKKHGVKTYAACLPAEGAYDTPDYCKGTAFLIGNEGNGLTRETMEMADHKIMIPMAGHVESLNAAIAASILMYEVSRQRRAK